MEVSLAPEAIFNLGHFSISNSIFTGWLVTLFLLGLAFLLRMSLTNLPGRVQTLFEMLYAWLLDLTETIIGRSDVAREIFPYLITLFLFIVFSNWSGLLPGFGSLGVHEQSKLIPLLRAPTSDLNTVAGLAVISMTYVQYLGFKYAGVKGYLKKFFNFQNPIGFFIGLLELIGEFTRVISFSFRLFGNVFAGEVLISVMFFLTITLLPYVAIIPLPFFILELFVGVIQAFIFCFLTIIFISLAVVAHDASGHVHGGEELEVAPDAAQAEFDFEHGILHPIPKPKEFI